MTYEPKRTGTKVVTGTVRLSYANVHEPRGMDGQDPKYSVSLIIPKEDAATLKALKEAIEEAKENYKGKWGGKIPAGLKTPLRDGDNDRADDEAYEGSYFVNANSKRKPQIVDLQGNKDLGPDDVYSGCYARASVNFFGYNTNGNRGIGCGLGNIQKLEDGEPLGGFSSAEADFGITDDVIDEFLT